MADSKDFYDSFDGYLAKIRMRTTGTLLVEGRDDWRLMSQLVLELSKTYRLGLVIDSVEVVREVPDTTSNREKVEKIHKAIGDSSRFGAYVDREFRGFLWRDGRLIDEISRHNVEQISCFWTRGHSTENYFLTPEYCIRFLEFWLPGQVDAKALAEQIASTHRQFVLAAVCLSFFLYQTSLLSKSIGILRRNHWKLVDEKYELDLDQISQDLQKRGVRPELAAQLHANYAACKQTILECLGDNLRWATHGHIGWDAVWTGLSSLLANNGVSSSDVLDVVEKGQQEVKRRCAAELWITRMNTVPDEKPDELLAWLQSLRAA